MTPGSWAGTQFSQAGRSRLRMDVLAMLVALAFAAAPACAQEPCYRGVDIFDAVCWACHTDGVDGAPRIGDRAAWDKRAAQGLEGLTHNALKGIRGMPPHGGNTSLTRLEIQRAIVYMVNASGGNWVEPPDPRPAGPARSGAQVVTAYCALCHEPGFDGAPRIGDRNAWLPRTRLGIDPMVHSVIRGHGAMPPRGGQANLTDAELRDAVIYMISSPGAREAADRKAQLPR
jgi:cytochrome c5